MNGPNKVKCYITLGWKGLPETNALAYFAQFLSYKDNGGLWIQPPELYSQHFILFATNEWAK
jgi:hypothetical protein